MYYLNDKGERVYTLKVREREAWARTGIRPDKQTYSARSTRRTRFEVDADAHRETDDVNDDDATQKTAPDGTPTQSAHPARFSPDDKFSKQRVALKKRFNLLPTQQKEVEL